MIRVALAGLLLVLAPAAPAVAADDMLQLSNTGHTWSSHLPRPLFDPAVRWIPGDSRTATFYVRNNTGDPGLLTIGVPGDRAGSLLASGQLRVEVTARNRTWAGPRAVRSRDHLKSGAVIAPQRTLPVTVRVTFAPQAGNETQLLASQLRLKVHLRQAGSSGTAPGTPDGPAAPTGPTGPTGPDRTDDHPRTTGLLPDTGARGPLAWLTLLGALAVGTGLGLVGRRRPDDHDDDTSALTTTDLGAHHGH